MITRTSAMTRRGFLSSALAGAAFTALAGCGGGGGDKSTPTTSKTPTTTTRAKVQSLHGQVARFMSSTGATGTQLAFARNSYCDGAYGNGAGYATGGGTSTSTAVGAPVPAANDAATASASAPNLGGFLKNIAAVSHITRSARIASAVGRHARLSGGRDETKPEPTDAPPDYIPPPYVYTPYVPTPTFYFDYYLGLWTQTEYAPGKSTYTLFEDEAKTKTAGKVETSEPSDYYSFPLVYESTYSFTAGPLAGSHGTSKTTTQANYASVSAYDDLYADGWKDSGNSNSSGAGDYSWKSRTESPDKLWTEGVGTFLADGSGGTRLTTSDGFSSDYRYNRDGSGKGTIKGGEPGMPVTIVWDAYGNTTITYADGTIERYSGYGGYTYGGSGYVGGNNGGVNGGVVPVDTAITNAPDPAALPTPHPGPSVQ